MAVGSAVASSPSTRIRLLILTLGCGASSSPCRISSCFSFSRSSRRCFRSFRCSCGQSAAAARGRHAHIHDRQTDRPTDLIDGPSLTRSLQAAILCQPYASCQTCLSHRWCGSGLRVLLVQNVGDGNSGPTTERDFRPCTTRWQEADLTSKKKE
jgi:hypothetical protein